MGGGGTLDFKRRGDAKDFFRFEIRDFGMFLGKIILASILSFH